MKRIGTCQIFGMALATALATGCTQDPLTSADDVTAGFNLTARAAATCMNVSGTGIMDFFDPSTPPVTLFGDLTGISIPGFPTFRFHGQGAYHGSFSGDVFITNEFGTFYADSEVVFAPIDPSLERWTGRFEVTSGDLVTNGSMNLRGTLNLATGVGEFAYHGRLCS